MTIEFGPASAARSSAGGTRRRRVVDVFIAVCAVAILAGCGEDELPPGVSKAATAFDDVPATVRDAAAKAVPGVKFNEAWKNLDRDGKLHSYEIRGKNPADGKIREVRVSTTGEILEME